MLNFFTKALIKSQLKGIPPQEVEKIFNIIEKNPNLFKKIAEDIQAKMKSGMSQEEAAQKVITENTEEIRKISI